MTLSFSSRLRIVSLLTLCLFIGGAGAALLGVCGPFTDVSDPNFCGFVLEIFSMAITTGTTPTTYDPTANVSRLQMAAFLSRTVDRTLQRGSRRAPLRRFWNVATAGTTTLGRTVLAAPWYVESDGTDVWASSATTVERVRGSDGRLLETWTGIAFNGGVLSAMGQVFVAGGGTPGRLYWINPALPAGAVTTVASNLGDFPLGIAFDGVKIWTGNIGGSVSIVTPGDSIPWTATTATAGFSSVYGMVFDGVTVWATDDTARTLLRLGANGGILQTVTVGFNPRHPAFDGTNIWVPNAGDSSVSVVRASSGVVLTTLTGNALSNPITAAFDGERVLLTNTGNGTVSLFKAASLEPAGAFPVGASSQPHGACSDGVNFWIALQGAGRLLRF